MGKEPILEVFLTVLSISLHPVIKAFGNFIYVISLTLSTTSQKRYVRKISGFDCIVVTRPLFLRLEFPAFLMFFTLCQYICRNLNNLKFGQDVLYLYLY